MNVKNGFVRAVETRRRKMWKTHRWENESKIGELSLSAESAQRREQRNDLEFERENKWTTDEFPHSPPILIILNIIKYLWRLFLRFLYPGHRSNFTVKNGMGILKTCLHLAAGAERTRTTRGPVEDTMKNAEERRFDGSKLPPMRWKTCKDCPEVCVDLPRTFWLSSDPLLTPPWASWNCKRGERGTKRPLAIWC